MKEYIALATETHPQFVQAAVIAPDAIPFTDIPAQVHSSSSDKLVILQLASRREGGALPKILVAEDEPEVLMLYKILLEDKGYQVLTTIDGKECLDAYQTELNKSIDNLPPFDLVVLDHRMPKKNGVDVAKEILELCPTQRLLMVTVYAGQLDLQDEKLKKMQIIQKPFDADELLNTISQLVTPQ